MYLVCTTERREKANIQTNVRNLKNKTTIIYAKSSVDGELEHILSISLKENWPIKWMVLIVST